MLGWGIPDERRLAYVTTSSWRPPIIYQYEAGLSVYGYSYHKDKTVVRSSYLYNGISVLVRWCLYIETVPSIHMLTWLWLQLNMNIWRKKCIALQQLNEYCFSYIGRYSTRQFFCYRQFSKRDCFTKYVTFYYVLFSVSVCRIYGKRKNLNILMIQNGTCAIEISAFGHYENIPPIWWHYMCWCLHTLNHPLNIHFSPYQVN